MTEVNRYEIGQIWKYDNRIDEDESILVIVGVLPNQELGEIISVYVHNISLKNPKAELGFIPSIQHMPFTREAIDASAIELLGFADELPDFAFGYNSWLREFESRDAGVFTVTVKEAIDMMETSINS